MDIAQVCSLVLAEEAEEPFVLSGRDSLKGSVNNFSLAGLSPSSGGKGLSCLLGLGLPVKESPEDNYCRPHSSFLSAWLVLFCVCLSYSRKHL